MNMRGPFLLLCNAVMKYNNNDLLLHYSSQQGREDGSLRTTLVPFGRKVGLGVQCCHCP